jgi:hypothetical protein
MLNVLGLTQPARAGLELTTYRLLSKSTTPRLRQPVHLYGDVTTAGEGLQNLGPCPVLSVFEQGGIFIVPHLL